MISDALMHELWEVAQEMHTAMHTDDGQPEPFRDWVTVLLIEHACDADPRAVFGAVLLAAASNNPDPIQLFRASITK